MQELLLKRNHLFFLHKLLRVPKDAQDHFCGSQAQISAQKMGFAPKFSSDIRSAAGELFTGPHQSLPEMSDGHWGTLHCRY